MRKRITLQQRVITPNDGGFQIQSWTDVATVWSRWTNVHGSESWSAAALQAEKPATVLIRYRSGIDESYAILKGSERYEIVSMDNIRENGEYNY